MWSWSGNRSSFYHYFHILSRSGTILTDPVRSDCLEPPEADAASPPAGADLQRRTGSHVHSCNLSHTWHYRHQFGCSDFCIALKWIHSSKSSCVCRVRSLQRTWHREHKVWSEVITHTQPALSSPVWMSQGFRNPAWKAFNRLTLVADLVQFVFVLSLLNLTAGVWQEKSPPATRRLPCQSPLVFLALFTWTAFISTFRACRATVFSSVGTLWYLNGIKHMWWVERRLNGHWSVSVISPSTLRDVSHWITETGILSIRFCCRSVSGMLSSIDLSSEP